MSGNKFYLKPNVVIEPLFDRWYAWSHLISPATAAMNVVGRHLDIMDSFIVEPAIHAEAVLNPKMKGGPFMDIPVHRVEEVKELYDKTVQQQDKALKFSKAVKELDRMLEAEGKGMGMETLYEKVPPILKGYVELFYDRNNHADFRFFEALLYKSPFYNKSSQSIALWVTENDHRPFCLSATPQHPV